MTNFDVFMVADNLCYQQNVKAGADAECGMPAVVWRIQRALESVIGARSIKS